jgi:tetratricopeptide (TPR) repeat protein
MLSVEKDNIEKANLYYLWGNILERKNDPRAAYRYKDAVKFNPNFGNAYFRLAILYSKNDFTSVKEKNKYKYFLCLDKLERAKECVKQYAGSATMAKYNTASISDINGYIESFKTYCPTAEEIFMLGEQPNGKFTFPAGIMKGESTTLRFF